MNHAENQAVVAIYSNSIEKIKNIKKSGFNFYEQEIMKSILLHNNNKIIEIFDEEKIINVIHTMNDEIAATILMECYFNEGNKKIKELFSHKILNGNLDYLIYEKIFFKLYYNDMEDKYLKILENIFKEGFDFFRKYNAQDVHDLIVKQNAPEIITLCENLSGKSLNFNNEKYTLNIFKQSHQFLEVYTEYEEQLAIKYLSMLINRNLPVDIDLVLEEILRIKNDNKSSNHQLNLINYINMEREKQVLSSEMPEVKNERKKRI